jgi:hypothetical protein
MPPPGPDVRTALRTEITEYDHAEQVADTAIVVPAADKLRAFRTSVDARVKASSLSREQRNHLRDMMTKLKAKDAGSSAEYDRLHDDLRDTGIVGGAIDLAGDGVRATGRQLAEGFNNAPVAGKVIVGATALAFVVGTAILSWNYITKGASAAKNALIKTAKFMIIPIVAFAGFAGIGAITRAQRGGPAAGPDEAALLTPLLTKLENAVKAANPADTTAALAELTALSRTKPGIIATCNGKEFTQTASGKKLTLQFNTVSNSFALIEKEALATALREAEAALTAAPVKDAVTFTRILNEKAGLPAKTDFIAGFRTHFSAAGKLMIGGKDHYLQFNAAGNTFALVDKQAHDAAVNAAAATMAKPYPDAAAWVTELNLLLASSAGDMELQKDMLARCSNAKDIGMAPNPIKKHLLVAQGEHQFRAIEDTRLAAVESKSYKGSDLNFIVFDENRNPLDAKLKLSGGPDDPVVLSVGPKNFHVLKLGMVAANKNITAAEKRGDEMLITASALGFNSKVAIPIAALERFALDAHRETRNEFPYTIAGSEIDAGGRRTPDTTSFTMKQI